MLQEGKGPINFTVFLTLFGEKLNGELAGGLSLLSHSANPTSPDPGAPREAQPNSPETCAPCLPRANAEDVERLNWLGFRKYPLPNHSFDFPAGPANPFDAQETL
jgi:hypothetical protein